MQGTYKCRNVMHCFDKWRDNSAAPVNYGGYQAALGNPSQTKARRSVSENSVSENQELPVLSHWIGGAEALSSSDRTAPVFDPARGIETKRVALANASDIEAAISSANKAFPAWRDLSITKRQQIIFRFRELLNERKGELAQIITAEHGKVVSDALGEITRGQEVVELATGFPHLIKGEHSENVSTGVDRKS